MDCRGDSFTIPDPARGLGILPAERLGMLGVGIDVAAQLPGQIGGRREDAAGDDVALHLGEPQLDLIQPRRIGGREVEADVGCCSKNAATVGVL